jgi:uncharacterized protein involved in exopolysaccharide biosynthesis
MGEAKIKHEKKLADLREQLEEARTRLQGVEGDYKAKDEELAVNTSVTCLRPELINDFKEIESRSRGAQENTCRSIGELC